MKTLYRVKFNYRQIFADNSLGELSKYEVYNCSDMSYDEALNHSDDIKDSLIYDLSHGTKEDYSLEEFYILKP